ncbi:MAG TPA: hypothetical protein VH560_14505 [Polyangia bacterium]|nr:hypothetical protein [Polyangia bacterium]
MTGSAGASGSAGSGAAGAGTAGADGQTAGANGTAGGGTAGQLGTAGAAAGSGGSGGSVAGATGSAGATVDAGTDAQTDASDGASSGCPYTLCETFSGVAPGATGSPWLIDVDKLGTVIETVTNKGHGDSTSLHVKTSAMSGVRGYLTEMETLAKTGASFWGRVYIWYMLDVAGVHIVNAAVDGKTAANASEQVRIVNVIGGHIATNRRSDDMGKGSNVAPDQGKWGCYEWHITPSSLDVYLDGTMLPISETWTEPTISLFRVGFERFAAGAAGDLWLDDIAINDKQIGCN